MHVLLLNACTPSLQTTTVKMSQEQVPVTKEETQEEASVVKDAGGAQVPAETAPDPETGGQQGVQDASALTSVWNGLRLHPKTWEPTDDPKSVFCFITIDSWVRIYH